MRRVFWTSAALALAVQLPRLMGPRSEISVDLLLLPVAGLVLFLAGLGFAVTDAPASTALVAAAAFGGTAVALLAAPFHLPSPAAELAVFLLGGVCVIAAAAWVSVQHRLESFASSLLVGLGGTAGVVVLWRAALRAYLAYSETYTTSPRVLVRDALEMTAGFGLGGAMLAAAGFLHRWQRRARRGRGP